MDWEDVLAVGHFDVGGNSYDISHLKTVITPITIPKSERFHEINTVIVISYSSHCISRALKHGDEIVNGVEREVIYDGRGIARIVCDIRYSMSKNLPTIMLEMMHKKCYQTGYRNFTIIECVDSAGTMSEYHVYFRVKKKNNALSLFVESAYIPVSPLKQRPSRPMRMPVLLAKTYRGETIRT